MGLLHRAPRGRALSHRYSSSPTPYSVRPAPSIARFLGVWSVVVALLFGCFFFFVEERGWRTKRGGARANLGTRPSPGLTPAKPRGVFRSRRPAAERTHAPPPRANAQKKCSNEGQFHALQLPGHFASTQKANVQVDFGVADGGRVRLASKQRG
jgi:hypothetical protein